MKRPMDNIVELVAQSEFEQHPTVSRLVDWLRHWSKGGPRTTTPAAMARIEMAADVIAAQQATIAGLLKGKPQ